MAKKKIIFCKIDPSGPASVAERYDMVQTYAFEYLAAWAKKYCHSASVYSFKTLTFAPENLEEDIVFSIALEKPFAAGFSCSVKNYFQCVRIARQVKLASPTTKIIFGGPEMFDAKRIMDENPFIDFAVSGEGEETFSELLESLAGENEFSNIKGLTYRNKNGAVKANARRSVIKDLSAVPSIITLSRAEANAGIVLYETGRGCPNKCSYCLWSPYAKREFPIARIKKELRALLSNRSIERIWFIDSDFDSDPDRAKKIISFVIENRKHNVGLSAFLNFNTPDAELIEMVGKTFFEAPVGLQTIKPDLLRNVGRGWFSLEKFEETISMVLKHLPPEKIYVDLMYGLPGERPGDLMDSLVWCVERGLTHINFFRTAVFPGTPLWRNASKYGLLFDPEPPHLVYSSDTFSYDNLIETEDSIVSYKILRETFGDEDLTKLAKANSFPGVLKGLRNCSPDFNSHFTEIDESNIADIDTGMLKPLVEKWMTVHCPRKSE